LQYVLLLLAMIVVASIRMALAVLPSRMILRVVWRSGCTQVVEASKHAASVDEIVWAIGAASRRIPRATCLTQALSASLLLRWFGYDARLCLGVGRNGDGSLRAHAWLERAGYAVVGGEGIPALVRLPDLSDHPQGRAATSLSR
jgi:hypothetical protein